MGARSVIDHADVMGCVQSSLPIQYLGFPLGFGIPKTAQWDMVVECIEQKLATWKKQYLSFGGRITLIKAALSNIPAGRGSGMWRSITSTHSLITSNIRFKVGKGESVRFWMDLWSGDTRLMDAFPAIFRLATEPNASIANYMVRGAGHGNIFWDIRLRRDLKDSEIGQFESLLSLLSSYYLSPNVDDCWIWIPDSQGGFSVRSFFRLLTGNHGQLSEHARI
ncbi:uncharacterized protein LOC143878817 [Tasmannia lanceolata]|uniref:uncharacterized protein LOC143878817 n=1 Tax=Tasmannia lanceolata TaxID=3420 RepID=UPI004063A0F8